MKLFRRIPDPPLVLLALLATLAGLFFIFDAGYARSLGEDRGLLPSEFRTQLVFTLIAVLGGAACIFIKAEAWPKIGRGLFLVCLVLLCLVPRFGHEMNGAKRWIGFGPVSVQPAEFAKLAVVLYLAAVFHRRKPWPSGLKPRRDWAHWMDTVFVPKVGRILPAIWAFAAVWLTEKEPDLGTAAVIGVTAFFMFVLGRVSRLSLIVAVVVAFAGCCVMVKQEPYRWDRIKSHFHRWDPGNVDDTAYQTVQSELAIATGGWHGLGIGNGRAKEVIPAPTTDFIWATVGEEFGLAGSLAILAVIGGITWRLLHQARRVPSRFASLVLNGFASWIGIQTCVNIMMANGTLPAIGIPLPFISSGGSSLLALWCGIGVCQSLMASPLPEPASGEGPASRRSVVHVPKAVRTEVRA
jgi:cell division protein FtsW